MMHFEYSDRVKMMKPSIIREIIRQMSDPALISFAGGNPAAEAFPQREIREISDELLANHPVETLQYSLTDGVPGLREAARSYLGGQGGLVKETDDIMVVSGSQQIMDFMTKLLCNPGDIVATEDPAFLGGLNSFRSFGVQLAGVPLGEDGVDLDVLEKVFSAKKKPKFYYTIPNFQNPTGVTTSAQKRRDVYNLAVKYGVPILEDDPYGQLRISGDEIAPIKALDDQGAVVYAASMSKIIAPGMRIAFCVGAKQLLANMVVAKQSNDVHSNVWAQKVCEQFLKTCDMDAHIARLRGIYRDKAQCMVDAIEREMPGKLSYAKPEGGMFLWLTLPKGVDMLEYVKNCLAHKLALVPGNAFYVDDTQPRQAVRANFTTPSNSQIQQGVRIMAQVLADMQRA